MSLWMFPAYVIATLLVIGPLGSFLGVWGPQPATFLFFIGIFLSAVSGIGLAGAAAFAATSGRPWRSSALRGSAGPLAVAVVAVALVATGDAPPMNDISTDLDDRPRFAAGAIDVAAGAGEVEAARARMKHFAALQRENYPDLGPVLAELSPEESFDRAVDSAHALGWDVVTQDRAAGRIAAEAESRIFHYVDDIVIRIRAEGSGSRVDLRSRSRMGQGDLGANAARIRAFAAVFGG